MNTSYLLSVLNLYLLKEKNGKLIIEVDNIDNLVKVNFSYSFDHSNKTYVKIAKDMFFSVLKEMLQKFQGNAEVLKEELTNNIYTFSFSDERRISFINFSLEERQKIRSNFSNIKETVNLVVNDNEKVEIKVKETPKSYNDIYAKLKNFTPSFSFGFTSYINLFLTTIWILDVLMIALLVFKVFIK